MASAIRAFGGVPSMRTVRWVVVGLEAASVAGDRERVHAVPERRPRRQRPVALAHGTGLRKSQGRLPADAAPVIATRRMPVASVALKVSRWESAADASRWRAAGRRASRARASVVAQRSRRCRRGGTPRSGPRVVGGRAGRVADAGDGVEDLVRVERDTGVDCVVTPVAAPNVHGTKPCGGVQVSPNGPPTMFARPGRAATFQPLQQKNRPERQVARPRHPRRGGRGEREAAPGEEARAAVRCG